MAVDERVELDRIIDLDLPASTGSWRKPLRMARSIPGNADTCRIVAFLVTSRNVESNENVSKDISHWVEDGSAMAVDGRLQ